MDFGFCGPAYTANSPYQDSQELINWYLEKDPTKADGERGQFTLYPTPGLVLKLGPVVIVPGARTGMPMGLLLALTYAT
jgi:hypothetical protein